MVHPARGRGEFLRWLWLCGVSEEDGMDARHRARLARATVQAEAPATAVHREPEQEAAEEMEQRAQEVRARRRLAALGFARGRQTRSSRRRCEALMNKVED